MNRLQKNLSAFVVVALMAINIYSCGGGGGDLACRVACDKAGELDQTCYDNCLVIAEDTLTSNENALTDALSTE